MLEAHGPWNQSQLDNAKNDDQSGIAVSEGLLRFEYLHMVIVYMKISLLGATIN